MEDGKNVSLKPAEYTSDHNRFMQRDTLAAQLGAPAQAVQANGQWSTGAKPANQQHNKTSCSTNGFKKDATKTDATVK